MILQRTKKKKRERERIRESGYWKDNKGQKKKREREREGIGRKKKRTNGLRCCSASTFGPCSSILLGGVFRSETHRQKI